MRDHKGIILIIGLGLIGVILYGDMQEESRGGSGLDVTVRPVDGNPVTFRCEVADTPLLRAQGLSDRDDLPEGRGMLFVYEYSAPRSFWMYNVSFGLDIIFIDDSGIILNVESASPGVGIMVNDLPHYYSNGDTRYVLEINRGVSAEAGIRAGTVVDFSL